ncbi:NUDIX hydrolase [Streptococcus pneumoniae]
MIPDIYLHTPSGHFRYRAAAIIIENDAICFIGNPHDDYLYSLGGAVKLGETSEEALLREIKEETGQVYAIDRLICIHENFFVDHGQNRHEICLYYLMKSKGKTFLAPTDNEETVHWIPISELSQHRLYPNFLDKILQSTHSGIHHIVTSN